MLLSCILICSSLIFPLSLEAETSRENIKWAKKGLKQGVPANSHESELLLKWGRGDSVPSSDLVRRRSQG